MPGCGSLFVIEASETDALKWYYCEASDPGSLPNVVFRTDPAFNSVLSHVSKSSLICI